MAIVPFVNRTFEWGAVIATSVSLLSVVPRHCAHLTYFLHPPKKTEETECGANCRYPIPPAWEECANWSFQPLPPENGVNSV